MNSVNKYGIKVCGMKISSNIEALISLEPDFIWFIFYKKSKRFIPQIDLSIDYRKTKKVGVFVDEPIESVIEIVNKNNLDLVQLHGQEDPSYCNALILNGISIIKAFKVDEHFDFNQCASYNPFVSYFLFDAKGKLPGGNGISYDWNILANYKDEIPYLLSGGIDVNSIDKLKEFSHKKCVGIDINSGFELEPGLKNIEEIIQFKAQL